MHGVTTKQIRNDFNLQDGQTDIIAALVTVPTYLLKEENKTLKERNSEMEKSLRELEIIKSENETLKNM